MAAPELRRPPLLRLVAPPVLLSEMGAAPEGSEGGAERMEHAAGRTVPLVLAVIVAPPAGRCVAGADIPSPRA